MVDIDLKGLIIEAYTKGQQELLYVIPFVAKVCITLHGFIKTAIL